MCCYNAGNNGCISVSPGHEESALVEGLGSQHHASLSSQSPQLLHMAKKSSELKDDTNL